MTDPRHPLHRDRGLRAARHSLFILVPAMVPFACTAATSQSSPVTTSTCVIVADEPRTHLTLGVSDAPGDVTHARLHAERMLSAQVFETLVRVDCTGRVLAGLADEWSSADGRTWRFGLRPGAAFHDGVAVTARTVVEAWSTARIPSFADVTAIGAMDLVVTLVAAADAPVFADAAHAVVRRTAAGAVGTGLFRFDGDAEALRVVSASEVQAPQSIAARLFAGDARNALDAGVDALVTGDPSVLAYARARSDYAAVPLPWSRTYVLASSGRAASSRPSAAELDALARDAVRGDARAAQGPFWWERCGTELAPSSGRVGADEQPEVVYPEGDVIARGIAERIAALAWPAERAPDWLRDVLPSAPGASSPPVARGLGRDALAAAISARTVLAVIAPLSAASLGGCVHIGTALRDGTGSLEDALLAAAAGWSVTPLLDARDHLVHRAGLGRVTVDGAGIIRFSTGP